VLALASAVFLESESLGTRDHILLSLFLRIFFSEKDDSVRETKIVQQEKNTVKVKEASRKVTRLQIRGNHVGKKDKTPNLGPCFVNILKVEFFRRKLCCVSQL
jgi:hypothetical protein